MVVDMLGPEPADRMGKSMIPVIAQVIEDEAGRHHQPSFAEVEQAIVPQPDIEAIGDKAQEDADGWLASGHLPGLRNNQTFGTALGHEIQVAIRDAGMFMDPRSQKDWWR